MKIIAIIANVIIPGIGSMLVGQFTRGIAQLVLFAIGVLLTLGGSMALVGIALSIIALIWSLHTVFRAYNAPARGIAG